MKRFYKTVSVDTADGGHMVRLDARILKTPARETLLMPTRALADAVAEEWRAQGDTIDPENMPITRLANTTQDRVLERHANITGEICAFAGTDLLCYRANEPADLIEKQAEMWDPYLAWARDTLDVGMLTTTGIMPVSQPEEALAKLRGIVDAHDPYDLTALHGFTNGLGSLILALACMRGFADLDAVWHASLVDVAHQEERWGTDWEVEDKRNRLRADLDATAVFLSHVRNK